MTEIPAQRGGPPPREILREAYRAAESRALVSSRVRALSDDSKVQVMNEAPSAHVEPSTGPVEGSTRSRGAHGHHEGRREHRRDVALL
ncbi:hypothetical protein [Streptomyces sp. NBC_01233]|uniref:hypothetical protein n=1 Tax=Streptomyces sp. NBC_01233 TaxID=2903787 RepID=UPI002E10607D|nr:hypothetical protein OG332_33470 [Streptomyces sp. NBC_01233]